MSKRTIKTQNGDNLPSVQEKTELAVRIVGATLNQDMKTLYNLLEKYKDEDGVAFCIMGGIFNLLSEKGVTFEDILSPVNQSFYYRPYPEIFRLLSLFKNILNKREYEGYGVALMPGSSIKKENFLEESFLGIFSKLFEHAFFGNNTRYDGNDAFIVSDCVKCLIDICLAYKVVTEDFCIKLRTVVMESIDTVYFSSLSSAKSKVWDARRSATDYFIKQFFVFNDAFLKEDQQYIIRRWKAWFVLEDRYKIEEKKVVRKNLKQEMLSIYNIYT